MSTTTLRNRTTKPALRDAPSAGSCLTRARSAGRPMSLASWDTEPLLDLPDNALVRVEEVGGDRVPATELVDVEQPGRSGEVHGGVGLHDRRIAVLGEDLRGGVGVREFE